MTAIELRMGEMNKDWPTPQEAKLVKAAKKKVSKISFADKFKDKAKDTIVLLGDLARGVGETLMQQSHMMTTKKRGGARIEQVTEQISLLQNKVDRHLVVLVGTNNVQNVSNESIHLKYNSLLEASKKVKN